jgi:hypothetical protein
MSKFDEELEKVRTAALRTAAESVPHLYNILVTDEGRDHNDAREILYDRLQDIWSRATIRKFLPDEVKDEKKSEWGKQGREKQLEEARKLRAEQSSDLQKEPESKELVMAVGSGGKVLVDSGANTIAVTEPPEPKKNHEGQKKAQNLEDEMLSDDADSSGQDESETAAGELTKDERIAQLEEALKQSKMFNTAAEIPKVQSNDVALPDRLFSAVFLAIRNGEKKCIWCTVENNEIVRIEANSMRVKRENAARR